MTRVCRFFYTYDIIKDICRVRHKADAVDSYILLYKPYIHEYRTRTLSSEAPPQVQKQHPLPIYSIYYTSRRLVVHTIIYIMTR